MGTKNFKDNRSSYQAPIFPTQFWQVELMWFYIGTHRRDPDGICSGAILARYAQHKRHPFELFFCDYVTLEGDLQEIQRRIKRGSFIALIDLGIDNRLWPSIQEFLDTVKKQDTQVYWGDHHAWTKDHHEKVREMGVEIDHHSSEEAVSAEIVYRRFLPQDPIARRLSEFARDHDLWLRTEPVAMGLADVITYYDYLDTGKVTSPHLTQLTLNLSEGNYWSDQLEVTRTEYLTKKAHALEQSLTTAQEVTLGKFQIIFFFADPLLSSTEAGNVALERSSADLSVGVWPDGRLGFRRANEDLNCATIAGLFGGGGHAFAAGAELPESISNHIFPEIVEKLTVQLKAYPHFQNELQTH